MTSPLDVSRSPVRRPGDGRIGLNYQPGMNRQNAPGAAAGFTPSGGNAVIEVVFSGPYGRGDLSALASAMLADMQYAVAAAALSNVMTNLNRSIQHPTPYYETQINMAPVANDLVVNDRRIVYGPWLEGVSSRNQSTRFKGYHSFRRAFEAVRGTAQAICERIVTQYAGRFNGS